MSIVTLSVLIRDSDDNNYNNNSHPQITTLKTMLNMEGRFYLKGNNYMT